MDQVKEALRKNTGMLDPIGERINFVKDLSTKMGVNPGAPIFFGGVLGSLLVLFLYGWVLFVTFMTVLYPSLRSIRAIESEAKADDKTWLTYWMVYGTFVVLETYIGFLLELIPYWHWIRLVFFVWLLVP